MSHFGWIDGGIVGLYLLVTMAAGLAVRRYVGGVEDFLLAGREMDLHLGIASLAATEFGIVTCMYAAESGYRYGFSGSVPGILMALAMFLVGWTGFCVKPLREAGVMTLPELFERRFGAGVRRASGVVIVLGGLLNMGVFLRMGGEFLMTVVGFGASAAGGAGWAASHRLELTMSALLLMVAVYTIVGGMLSVLVTDFLQFVVMSVGLVVVTWLLLAKIGFAALAETVEAKLGAGGFNPLANPEMGWPYLFFNVFFTLGTVLTWQTMLQRVMAARDARTGRRIYMGTAFFFVCRFLIPGLWGIAALHALDASAPGVTSLSAMPTWLAGFLPVGLMGLLIAAMLAADMSTDSSYMLTWTSVIYNDVIAPWRRPGWTERKGLLLNRLLVAVIGVFLLFYGLWYPLGSDLWTYLGVTAAIYLASMSTLLVACCYWRRATPRGAAAAIVVGALFPTAHLVLQQVAPSWSAGIGPYWSGILAYVGAALAMVVGSLSQEAA